MPLNKESNPLGNNEEIFVQFPYSVRFDSIQYCCSIGICSTFFCRIVQMAVVLAMALLYITHIANCSIVPAIKDILFVQANSTTASKDGNHTWNYKDTENWKNHFKQCGGNFQSPIDIEPIKAKPVLFGNLMFGHYSKPIHMNITNTGETVMARMMPKDPSVRRPFIQAGGLRGRYNFIQFHLHWGNNSKYGSEHTFRKSRYPAELHLVHVNDKYKTFKEAVKHKDGLAVLAIFLELGKSDNKALAPVITRLQKIKTSGQQTKVAEPIRLLDLLPANVERFYRYSGSLTTPECQEVVAWTVFEKASTLTETQLDKFRKLLDREGKFLVNNFRPVRKRGERIVVYRNWAFNVKAH